MKKAAISIAMLFGICLVLHGVVTAQGSAEMPGAEANGAALWAYLQKADYRTWTMWPGTEAFYKGQAPHGALLTTYVNGIALKAIEGKAGSLPNGSIIVMENYSPEKKLGAVAVMYKVKGYNPEAGDWFWARYLPGDKIDLEGKVGKCIFCHGQSKDNDYVTNHPLK